MKRDCFLYEWLCYSWFHVFSFSSGMRIAYPSPFHVGRRPFLAVEYAVLTFDMSCYHVHQGQSFRSHKEIGTWPLGPALAQFGS
jgi:hypothetical protein